MENLNKEEVEALRALARARSEGTATEGEVLPEDMLRRRREWAEVIEHQQRDQPNRSGDELGEQQANDRDPSAERRINRRPSDRSPG